MFLYFGQLGGKMSKNRRVQVRRDQLAQLQNEAEFWRSLWERTSETAIFTGLDGKIRLMNPAAETFLGISNGANGLRNILDFSNGSREQILQILEELSQKSTIGQTQLLLRTTKGPQMRVMTTADVIPNGSPTSTGILWLIRDLSEITALEEQLREAAIRDHLTGLYNRRYFDEALTAEVERREQHNTELSLLFIDLDDFKHRANDVYGHSCGDEVLHGFAELLETLVRKIDTLVRWGGEEFVVICPETDTNGAIALATKICQKIAEATIEFSKGKIVVTASIGIATFIPNGTAHGLVRKANKAMHYVKSVGKNRIWHSTWPIERESQDI